VATTAPSRASIDVRHDEGHGSVDIAAKIRRFSLVLDWLSDTLA